MSEPITHEIPQQSLSNETFSKPGIEPNYPRQRKITAYLLTGAAGVLDTIDVREITREDHDNLLQKLSSGEINQTQIDKMLLLKDTALGKDLDTPQSQERAKYVWADLTSNKQGRAIIAELVKGDMNFRDNLTEEDILTFVKAIPSPAALEQRMEPFIRMITAANGPQKRAEYLVSADRMMAAVYGKRYEYWQQTKLLLEEAGVKYQGQPEIPEEKPKYQPDHNVKILEVIDMKTGAPVSLEQHVRRKLS